MLLLDYQNILIQSVLTERLSGAPPVNIDQIVSDFDGVTFHISTPEAKSKILVSINVKCFNELVRYGAQEVLEREYGSYVVAPETGYNFSVQIDLDALPEDKGIYYFLSSGFVRANQPRSLQRLEMISFDEYPC
jgi:actin related protein 2/3 complex subunit 2